MDRNQIVPERGLQATMKASKRTREARLFQAKRRAQPNTPTNLPPVSEAETNYQYLSQTTVEVLRRILGAQARAGALELERMVTAFCTSRPYQDPLMWQEKPRGLKDGLKKIHKGIRDLGRLLDSEECELAVRILHFEEGMSRTVEQPTDEELRAALANPTSGPQRSRKEVEAIIGDASRRSVFTFIDYRVDTLVPLRQRLHEAGKIVEKQLPERQRPGRGRDEMRQFLVRETLKILRRHGCPTTQGGFSGPSKSEEALAAVLKDTKDRVSELTVPSKLRGLVASEMAQSRGSKKPKPSP